MLPQRWFNIIHVLSLKGKSVHFSGEISKKRMTWKTVLRTIFKVYHSRESEYRQLSAIDNWVRLQQTPHDPEIRKKLVSKMDEWMDFQTQLNKVCKVVSGSKIDDLVTIFCFCLRLINLHHARFTSIVLHSGERWTALMISKQKMKGCEKSHTQFVHRGLFFFVLWIYRYTVGWGWTALQRQSTTKLSLQSTCLLILYRVIEGSLLDETTWPSFCHGSTLLFTHLVLFYMRWDVMSHWHTGKKEGRKIYDIYPLTRIHTC